MQPPCEKRRKINVVEPQIQNDIVYPEMALKNEIYTFSHDPWSFEMDEMDESHLEWSELAYSPETVTKCTIRGNGDHRITSCADLCCSKCGEITNNFQGECTKCLAWSASTTCDICGYRGHLSHNCPYTWTAVDHCTINSVPASKYSEYWMVNGETGGFYGGFMMANNKAKRTSIKKLEHVRNW